LTRQQIGTLRRLLQGSFGIDTSNIQFPDEIFTRIVAFHKGVRLTMATLSLALISIIDGWLDMLGTLYLAYDLLGGEHRPLRLSSQPLPQQPGSSAWIGEKQFIL